MPRTKQQNEKIKQGRRVQIESSALELFAKRGFHSATIADIAEHAGVSKGLMYSYFNSKEDLLHSILVRGFKKLVEDFDLNHDGVLTTDEMRFYINSLFKGMMEEKYYWKLYFSVTLQPEVIDKVLFDELLSIVKPFFAVLEKYLESRGFEQPNIEVVYFHSLLDGILLNAIMNEDFYPIDEIKELVIKRYVK
ncbi:MAG TPA: TetR/AcrR family transcriptional regulator [Tenuifilaceae bacterium]|nr:TetR/AcrR family transcriptional regulator [Tenuifilaceae bacterium]HPI45175.1 TetR/AcrR family transcriptional regulator [Tenuifilaceae bacterium]HPN22035.1 TetR/AcrR family transcriptional regulator [Tenuifilaceae bacterium]